MAASFPVSELDYDLPAELVAQSPPPQRGRSRLLIVDRSGDGLSDAEFPDLPGFLHPGDLLVLNNTRVVPARITVRRQTGARLDGLFLREIEMGVWEVLVDGAKRIRLGEVLGFMPDAGYRITARERQTGGGWLIAVDPADPAPMVLDRVGRTPLPPYIRRPDGEPPATHQQDRERYQTVYAESPGAVAAPTAGLHFTPQLLAALEDRGVSVCRVTLHVGLGTFAPVQVDDLAEHTMHTEWYELPASTAVAVDACRRREGRVVAVGTTSLRVLESCPAEARRVTPGTGRTALFCYPPFDFQVVDALVTNFHLPRSTLLALVMAFVGVDRLRGAYRHAVQQRYRFFSYGDAMLIL